jgi:PAS domain S-box-containing protein
MSRAQADRGALERELADLRGQLEQARRTIADLAARAGGQRAAPGPDAPSADVIPYARIGELIRTLAAGGEPKDWLGELVVQLREWSGCEAAGIRLKQGHDYPYFETRGFPEQFVALESPLCSRDAQGRPILDTDGDPCLDCMCGNVIKGRYDPSLAFFTGRGSFWSNNTSVLLAQTTPEQRQADTRNRCNGMGYQSVALTPLRFAGVTYGLLQFNDQRPDRFSPELIGFLELVADATALALSHLEAHKGLAASEAKYRALFDSAGDAIFIVDENLRFISANKLACERLGYTEAELLAMGPADIDDPEAARRLGDVAGELARNGAALFETVHVAKNGGKIPVEVNARMFSVGGAPVRMSIVRDLGERRRAEDALRASEERLRTIADFTYDWEYWRGPDGRLLWVSPSCERISGYAPGEFLADPGLLGKIVHPGDAALFREHERSVEAGGRGQSNLEFRIVAKSGETVWISHSCEAIARPDGAALGRRVSNHDVSDRKRLEAGRAEDLRRIEEESLKSRAVIDSLVEGLIVAAADGTIVTLNPAAYRIFGLGGDKQLTHYREVVAHYALRTRDGRVLAPGERPLARALRGESFSGCEVRVDRDSDGLSLIVSFSGAPVADGHGEVLFGVISFEDITARRLADAELKRQTVLLTSLIDSTPDLISIKDPNGLYLGCNPAFCEFLGKPQREIVGRTDSELFGPDIARSLHQRDLALLTDGKPRRDDQWITFLGRGEMLLDALTAPIFDAEGGLVGVLSMGRDITARHTLEQELRAAVRAAEKANAAKTMFLANMSHEIRTPLNGLMGMMQLLRATKLSAEQHEFADMAVRSGSRLTKLLSDILDLSRIESDRLTLSEKTFRLADVFGSLTDTFAPLSMEKGVCIQTEIEAGVPGLVVGDEVRIRQVIFNLVGNAMKFSTQGDISVSVSRLTPVAPHRARLLFVVGDSGGGIPDDKVGAVCEAFTQVDGSFTRNQQGAGLGLTITKRLVALMGGCMAIDSELGLGTSVYVMLPLGLPGAGDSAADQAARPAAGDARAYRILFAEDDPLSQFSVKRFLEKDGHEVVCVGDGAAVLTELARGGFDCILMDVQMPVMDGAEASRRIRADVSGNFDPTVPIIAVTAYAMSGDMERFQAAGMDGYIAKPLDFDALVALIDRTVAAKRAGRAASGSD